MSVLKIPGAESKEIWHIFIFSKSFLAFRSGIQSDFANCDPNAAAANFTIDPLQEFSSWYPPVWLQGSEEDYRLVDVPAGTQAYRSIKKFFHENLPETKIDIISLQQIQNLLHWDKYQRYWSKLYSINI